MFHIVAIAVYYCSLGYVAVAGIIYLTSLLLVLTDGEKFFSNRIGKNRPRGNIVLPWRSSGRWSLLSAGDF